MTSSLLVVMGGRVIGDIIEQGRGGRLLYADDIDQPLSLSMPLDRQRHRGHVVLPWLRNLLPDREDMLMQWRRAFGLHSNNPIDLLRHVGEEVAGATQFVRPDRLSEAQEWRPARPLDEHQVGDMLRRAVEWIPEVDPAASVGRFSLAGVQPKIALQRLDPKNWAMPQGINSTTHIIKPAIPHLQDQALNEHLTSVAARAAGLATVATEFQVVDGRPVVVVERYDRFFADGRWHRAHQEDLLQALGLPPELKYESQGGPGLRTVADLIRSATGKDYDVREYMRSNIFHWLTMSTDGHAKNYSFLLSGSQVQLAPVYDLNSFLFYGAGSARSLSMKIGAEYRTDRICNHSVSRVGVSHRWMKCVLRQCICG